MLKVIIKEILINICDNQSFLIFAIITKPSISVEIAKKLKCYEHTRDQGTLGSVTGCRHSRTPGRTYGFLIGRRRSNGGPSGPRDNLGRSHDVG
jgi:hypothetical protein